MPGTVTEQVELAIHQLQQHALLTDSQILVVGASTSEVAGKAIGTSGSLDIADAIVDALLDARRQYGFHLAVQSCEHINRALVVERETMERFMLEEVTVIPVAHAGGAVATRAFRRFSDPVMVESIRAHAGLDIGNTLIGMHLRPVAVPVRLDLKQVGQANLVAAVTRPKLVGGERAVYNRGD